MDYKLALENVKYDRGAAVRFVKMYLPNDATAKLCELLSDETLAELYVDAYKTSEWGL